MLANGFRARTARLATCLLTLCMAGSRLPAASSAADFVNSPESVNAGQSVPATLPPIKFAQITDVHLFDAGYKCTGSYVERAYQ